MIQLGCRLEESKLTQSTKNIEFCGSSEKYITGSIWQKLGFVLSIPYSKKYIPTLQVSSSSSSPLLIPFSLPLPAPLT